MTLSSAQQAVTPRQQPPHGSVKYRAILDTAEDVFGAQGFKKASVDDIATRAQVSKPLIYRYFSSKQHLFELVVDRLITEWTDTISAAGAGVTPSAAHSLRLIVRASLEFALSRKVLRSLLARESQLMLRGYSDVLDRGTNILRAVITSTLEKGVITGEIRTDVDLDSMAYVITQVCVSFSDCLLSGDAKEQESTLLDAVIETVLFGVVVKPGGTSKQ